MSTIIVTEKLAAYLRKKNLHHIIAEVAECKTCGGAVAEVYARPARDIEVTRLFDKAKNDPRLAASLKTFPCVLETSEAASTGAEPTAAAETAETAEAYQLVITNRLIKLDEHVELDFHRFLGVADIKITGMHI